MAECLDCGGAPLLMNDCNTCLGTGMRTATKAKKSTAPKMKRSRTQADDVASFDPSNFDPDYGSSRGRRNYADLFAALPPKPGPYATPEEALQSVWGYSGFRPGQREIIEEVVQGRDLLVVAATSFGKSITFQVPALLRQDRPVLVISPLIALQRDQVRALDERGVPALMLNSMLSYAELDARYTQIPDASLVYVAPERLDNPRFKEAIMRCPPWLVAVDEMHSIDEAGLSYRPAYRFIQEMTAKGSTQRPQWLAVTASATPKTVEGIRERLGLKHAKTIRFSVERRNLTYRVEQVRVGDKIARVGQLVRVALGEGGAAIVYTSFRKDAEEVLAPYLQRLGIRAEFYHAGLTKSRREEVEADFFGKRLHCVVATCAFGMGIDRSDVRLVVMYGMAKSVEDFYQSMGRAGRDGAPSKCVALYDAREDYRKKRWLIERGDVQQLAKEFTARGWTDEQMEQAKEMQLAQLDDCRKFLSGYRCRVQLLKAYFGEAEGTLCGRCDICAP